VKPKAIWTTVDTCTAAQVVAWMSTTHPATTIDQLCKVLGRSKTKVIMQLHGTGVPFTLGEFALICRHFRREPARCYLNILTQAAHEDNDTEEEAILRKIASDMDESRIIAGIARDVLSDNINRFPPRYRRKRQ
jgi:hypothetical protein